MDPIAEDELRRSMRMKQYEKHQEYIDELGGAEKKDSAKQPQVGKMNGKAIIQISAENSPIRKTFDHYSNKKL